MPSEQWITELDKILSEVREVLIKKNEKYGMENIRVFGERGVLIRANDKTERLIQLVWKNVPEPSDETIDDTWKDLVGYGIIGMMVHRGKW